ncbi:MAG: MFS transporter [Candidatus Pacebacteria bacterium]|mgnify:CR=1 FL=1|jgi:MFS transporter, DHA1 family, tetracycline resistance protein|nr:MFS transporter [Candidatus Paceibacterota bacterium]MBT4651982.1 MFS transporter [Candidatus Paceibacterota bacterium]MBT6756004.1 MFS transporter [Candidatus Paceibacterota bacterium]MBT6920808.1 MFS transporter [Candidatus Paceibacterota bacterium]
MKSFDKRLAIVFIIQITEVLGFSLILPFLPFYAQSYGATPFVVGLILTVFSLFQFISSPIMGKLSDTYGRRPLLMVSQFSTFISFIVLGLSNTLWMIFLSRAIDGLLGSNFTIAQAYISDITSKKNRSKAFGISGAAFGIGFLIGPAIGGYLSQFGFAIPAFLAAAISGISILLTYFFLPETVSNENKPKFSFKKVKILDSEPFKKYLLNKKTSYNLLQFFFYLLAHSTWVASFALYGNIKMGLTAQHIGFILAYIGLISIILRIKIIPKMIDIWDENKLILWGMSSVIAGLFIAPMVNSLLPFVGIMTLFSFGTGIVRPLLNGAISRSASEKEQGSIMGVANSLGSLSQIIGPLLGGFLLSTRYPESMLFVAAGIMSLGLIFFLKQPAQTSQNQHS